MKRTRPQTRAWWLRGRVVGEGGRPLKGVEACVGWLLALDEVGSVAVDRPECAIVTGTDGCFAFDERAFRDPGDDDWDVVDERGAPIEDDAGDDWRDGPWRVVLRHGTLYDMRDDIDFLDGPVDLGHVVFRPAATRDVRVVTPDGAPLQRGTLVMNLFTGTTATRKALIWDLPLDAEGAATVPLFGVAGEWALNWSVRAPGHAARGTRYDGDWRLPADAPLVLVARPGYRVRGRAVDSHGSPVSGLIVNIHGATPRAVAEIRAMAWHRTTAEDGTFEVDGFDRDGAALHLHDGWQLPAPPGEPARTLPYAAGTPRASASLVVSEYDIVVDVGDVLVVALPTGRSSVG